MGTYIKAKKREQQSIDEALDEAEVDHYVDCPNADFLIRAAACLLDSIFLVLLVSGIDRLFQPIYAFIGPSRAEEMGHLVVLGRAIQIALQATVVYFYCLGTVVRFGGTPAKLLLRLRTVDFDSGKNLSLYQAVLRELIGKTLSVASLGIGFLLPLFRNDKRTLHDHFSNTVVKRSHG